MPRLSAITELYTELYTELFTECYTELLIQRGLVIAESSLPVILGLSSYTYL